MNTHLTGSPFPSLVEAAFTGTDHHPAGAGDLPASLPLPVDLQALARDAQDTTDAAVRLLRIAAVAALHTQRLAPFLQASASLADPTAPSEVAPATATPERPVLMDEHWLTPLAHIRPVRWRLAHEYLAAYAQAGWQLPLHILPELFDWAERHPILRGPLRDLMGLEGKALARSKTDWHVVLEGPTGDSPEDVLAELQRDPEQLLMAGGKAGRTAAITVTRRIDPRAGRELLIKHFDKLFMGEHAPLIEALAEGLSDEDAPFLTSLCAHPDQEVRDAAEALLLRLPDAPTTRLACADMDALLSGTPPKCKLDAPETAPTEPPYPAPTVRGLSEPNQWLYQIARRIPLRWWQARLQLEPAALLGWAAGNPRKKALLAAWKDVLMAAPETDWCDALLASPPVGLFPHGGLELIRLLPQDLQDAALTRYMPLHEEHFAIPLILFLRKVPRGRTLSLPLSDVVIRTISRLLAAGQLGGPKYKFLVNELPELACLLHPQSLPRWAELPRSPKEKPPCRKALDEALHIGALRRMLHEEGIPPAQPS